MSEPISVVLLIIAVLSIMAGALVICRSHSVRHLNQHLRQTIAELESTEKTLRRRNQELELLHRAASAFSLTLEPDQVLEMFLEQVCQLLGAVGASVWLVDPDSGALVCRKAVGPQSTSITGWRLTPGRGIADWVTRHGKILIVPDAEQDERYVREVAAAVQLDVHSILAVPLRLKQEVIGALEVVDTAVDRFGPDDGTFVEALASTAAIAFENARLYARTRQDAQVKTLLLNEANHRVKNNLATIIGLLYAEQSYHEAQGAVFQEVIQDLINRVQTLAEVHSMLSASQWTPVSLSDLVLRIARASAQGVRPGAHLLIEVAPSPLQVTADQAHHLAMVIGELVTNAVKHSCDPAGNVHIQARAWSEDHTIVLQFRDFGTGYPEDVLEQRRYGVGLTLVQNIVVHSLQGELSLHNDAGAVATLRFSAQTHDAIVQQTELSVVPDE